MFHSKNPRGRYELVMRIHGHVEPVKGFDAWNEYIKSRHKSLETHAKVEAWQKTYALRISKGFVVLMCYLGAVLQAADRCNLRPKKVGTPTVLEARPSLITITLAFRPW